MFYFEVINFNFKDNFIIATEPLVYMVRGDAQEHFLDYEYSKQNSKILQSHYKSPSSFSGTFFNCHRIQFEFGALQRTFLSIYFSYQVQEIGLKT